ncbi:MAG: hypothetical protein IJI84_01140 [Clostridia bacterium]|nr:hypothetical protein [Clostridia bacterium]
MALKTQGKINTLSDEVSIKGCKPQDIAIPKDVITNAKEKWKKIEKAYKDYGPGVINNLRSIGKGDEPLKKFIEIIENPYETLCFYESYFENTRNYKEIEKYFEKARKTLETAAKRSRPFKEALDRHDFVYKTDDVKKLEYKENPDNDPNPKIRFTMLKDENEKPVLKFAIYCTEVINKLYTYYENARDEFHKKKEALAKKITEQEDAKIKDIYSDLPLHVHYMRSALKDVKHIPIIVDQLKEKANTKKKFQLKLFNSKELEDLTTATDELENKIRATEATINSISSYKFGNKSDIVRSKNTLIDNLYYQISDLQKDLGSAKFYNKTNEKLKDLIKNAKEQLKEIETMTLSKDGEEIKFNFSFKKLLDKITKVTSGLTDIKNDFDASITKIDKAIDTFRESYSAKSWAKWLAMKAGIGILELAKEVNKTTAKIEALNKLATELQTTLDKLSKN